MKNLILLTVLFLGIFLSHTSFAQTSNEGNKTPLVKKKTTKKKKKPTSKTTGSTATTPKSDAPPVNGTGGMPKMTFAVKSKDFGKVKTGDMPAFTYEFTNTGNAPLEIDIVSGCDCTEIDYTRTVVQPGEKGFIKAVYNTKKEEAHEHKKQLKKNIDVVLKQIHPTSGTPLVEGLTFDVFIVD
jgi:uncharacterized protein YxeA